jgi:predicted  nucleic acid-binding Zn-ribbon protein
MELNTQLRLAHLETEINILKKRIAEKEEWIEQLNEDIADLVDMLKENHMFRNMRRIE